MMTMLRNVIALACGAACVTALGVQPGPLATVKNNQPGAVAAVGGQPPSLVSGKPRFPIVPAGVPIKATPITRTTSGKGTLQARQGPVANSAQGKVQATNGQGAVISQTAGVAPQVGSGPVLAGKLAPKNVGPGKSAPPGNTPVPVSAPAQAPATPASTQGNAPATAASPAGASSGS